MNRSGNTQARCPRCGRHGCSVAAMNYAEMWRWHKSGSFSGSGLGIGGGGLGFGVGGGSYSERGEIKSKRADVFDEPRRYALPVLSVVLIGCMLAAFLANWPFMIQILINDGSPPPAGWVADRTQELSTILVYIAPLAGLVLLAGFLYRARINFNEQERLNAKVFPRNIERYNELRYCEGCNILYDVAGRSESGFERMMLAGETESACPSLDPEHVAPTTQLRIR